MIVCGCVVVWLRLCECLCEKLSKVPLNSEPANRPNWYTRFFTSKKQQPVAKASSHAHPHTNQKKSKKMTTMEQFAIQSRGRYYKSKYPAKALFELMSRHCCATQREIAIETDRYFKRYVSVSSVKELQTLLETPNLKALHLGACYASSVCENGDGDGNAKSSSTNTNTTNETKNGGAAVAVKRGATAIGRELVFEIDLTDY